MEHVAFDHPVVITRRNEIGEQEGLVAKYLKTAAGKSALAAAMAMPIRRNIDYSGIARKAFCIDPIPDGAIPHYYVYGDDEK